jgi:hypothetical protein
MGITIASPRFDGKRALTPDSVVHIQKEYQREVRQVFQHLVMYGVWPRGCVMGTVTKEEKWEDKLIKNR